MSVDDLVPLVARKPLGDTSLNLKLASGSIKSDAHIGGGLPVDFTFHAGGGLSVDGAERQERPGRGRRGRRSEREDAGG